jgi:hypothetical protein
MAKRSSPEVNAGSKLVSAGLFMFYALILAATCIMMFFGVKNMKK